jgi:hypothetical protein
MRFFGYNEEMNRKRVIMWGGVGVLLAVGLGVGIWHHQVSEEQQMAAVCQTFLIDTAELPSPAAAEGLRSLVVPKSPATALVRWIATENANAADLSGIHVTDVTVSLSHLSLAGGNPAVLSCALNETRHLSPKGQANDQAVASFWLVPAGHGWRISQMTITQTPPTTPYTPDHFQLNFWNLVPAPPLPEGQ